MAVRETEKPDQCRTHEPSLREVTVELDGLRALMDERDKRYTERDEARQKAVEAALRASDLQTRTIHEASQKAIEKADADSDKWMANANEWRGTLQDRDTRFALKEAVEAEARALRSEIQGLRESRAEGIGGKHFRDDSRANLAITVSILSVIVFIAVTIATHWKSN